MPNRLVLTKVVATLGPATDSADAVADLIREGVRVFRLNFSHGTLDEAEQRLTRVREAADRVGVAVGVLGDLSGPKIRVEQVPDVDEGGGLLLEPGQRVMFERHSDDTYRGDDGVVHIGTTYPSMVDEVEPGHRVLINDGAIRLMAIDPESEGEDDDGRPGSGAPSVDLDPEDDGLLCRVTHGGRLTSRKGVNLPDSEVSAPSLTPWDRTCAAWAVEHGVDYLALSFVRRAADVAELNRLLVERGRDNKKASSATRLPVIAKIEKPQAIAELTAVLEEADGVMVARGDLGVEMDLSEVPVLQKQIVQEAHRRGKPVIVATQMLESMIGSPTPTRAEVSDVANAILDGADATMLSGETAVGRYPAVCVATMSRASKQAEAYLARTGLRPSQRPAPMGEGSERMAALARGVAAVVDELDPKHVAIWSEQGGGARYLSYMRLRRPILAFSSDPAAVRRMAIFYGVYPVHMDKPVTQQRFLSNLDGWMAREGLAEAGDAIVCLGGEPWGEVGVTNQILVHRVGGVCMV